MKNKLNILQKFILLFNVIVLIYSCSTNHVDDPKSIQSTEFSYESKLMIESINTLDKELDKSISLFRTNEEFDQEVLDYYLALIGMEAGYISIGDLNQIINGISSSDLEDFEASIEPLPYSLQTKDMLNNIAFGNTIDNFEEIPGFIELDITEKELIMLSNEVTKEYIRNNDTIDVPCPSEACTVGFMLVGMAIGNTICGPPCGIVGGIVGFLIGNSMKNN